MRPEITFFCELAPEPLTALFHMPGLVHELATHGYGVALAIGDQSPERADVVRCLNEAGVRVHAWLLLPPHDGYWFNLRNYPQAFARYGAFREWVQQEHLHFHAVGLDIEPSLGDLQVAQQRGPRHLFDRAYLAQQNALYPAARDAYYELVATIRHDGYAVHTYQYPFIVDDRRAGTTVIQRMLDIIDLPADHEVLMLYSSVLQPVVGNDLQGAFVRSYGQHADGIAIGSTGGGVVIDPVSGAQAPRLTRDAWERDLRIAAQYTEHVHVFSLEGCVEQGWLERVAALDWSTPPRVPLAAHARMGLLRMVIGGGLWVSRYGWLVLGWSGWLVAGGMFGAQLLQRWRRVREP
jgi:hypothetical protein